MTQKAATIVAQWVCGVEGGSGVGEPGERRCHGSSVELLADGDRISDGLLNRQSS